MTATSYAFEVKEYQAFVHNPFPGTNAPKTVILPNGFSAVLTGLPSVILRPLSHCLCRLVR